MDQSVAVTHVERMSWQTWQQELALRIYVYTRITSNSKYFYCANNNAAAHYVAGEVRVVGRPTHEQKVYK